MKGIKLLVLLGGLAVIGCNRNAAPSTVSTVTTDVVSRIDTVLMWSRQADTIPCDDFEYMFFTENKHDTVFVEVEKQVMKVRTITRTDTVYRDKIIVTPAKVVNKNRNVGNTKVKNGSAGDNSPVSNKSGNTTKKNSWWWIFLAGYLSSVIVRRVVVPAITTYIPVLQPIKRFL